MVDLPALRQFAATNELWSQLEAREKLRTMYAAMNDLPVDYREAFVLFELEGWSLAQISESTGDSINTIASRVRRSRERLRALLERAEEAQTRSARAGGART